MYTMQIAVDFSKGYPKDAYTPACKVWNNLYKATSGNIEHDNTCWLDEDNAYYVWSESKEKLQEIYNSVDTEGFCMVIVDNIRIPEWSFVNPISESHHVAKGN